MSNGSTWLSAPPPSIRTVRAATWREQYRGALVDARGNETPITESMIRRALADAERLNRPRFPVPRR